MSTLTFQSLLLAGFNRRSHAWPPLFQLWNYLNMSPVFKWFSAYIDLPS
jgi:hypothetical protein